MNYAAFQLDLSNRFSCLQFIRSSLEPFGLQAPLDTDVKLEVEAGRDPVGTKVYRPYKRLAALLARAKNEVHLNKGRGGLELRDADKTIAAWEREQAELDAGLGLTLPAPGATGVTRSRGTVTVRSAVEYG